MDDLIRRQDAIEYFMTNTNWHDEEGCPIDDAEDKRALLTDYFNGVASAHQWIPVSERLPEKPGRYLCTYDHDGLVCLDIGRFSLFDSNEWLTQPIAWMPLPEPYEAPAPERDCEHCVHRKDKGCEKWDCEYERRQ